MKSEKELIQYLAAHDKYIAKIYKELIDELAKVGISIDDLPEDGMFSFDQYPQVKKKVAEKVNEYRGKLQASITGGINYAFALSAQANARLLLNRTLLSQKYVADQREIARKAFLSYRMHPKDGLSLSQNVWNYSQQARAEFEMAMSLKLQDGLAKGTSAEELGRSVRQYLNNPDMMYRRYHLKKVTSAGAKVDVVEWRRRVVDEQGNVHFVKEDLEHTGQGVYRSARKNALRLAGTEINLAYRYADWARWKDDPCILGIRIRLSENHTLNGEPFTDICDELQGDYPKEIRWGGWHPKCRCNATPITMSDDEFRKIENLSEEAYRKYKSPNRIKNCPPAFREWLRSHEDKIQGASERGTMPFWIRDNRELIAKEMIDNGVNHHAGFIGSFAGGTYQKQKDGTYLLIVPGQSVATPALTAPKVRTREEILAAAKARHALRTPEQIEEIRARWNASKPLERIERFKPVDVETLFYGEMNLYSTLRVTQDDDTFKNIPRIYRDRYNQIVRKLNEFLRAGVPTDPLAQVLHRDRSNFMRAELNEIDNIVKLSNNPQLQELNRPAFRKITGGYGYEKISTKMPNEFFSKDFLEKGIDFRLPKYHIKKEFFDKMPHFVSLYTKQRRNGSGAHFNPDGKYVVIATDNSQIVKKLKSSEWKARSMVYHEFGHATDHISPLEWSSDEKIRNFLFKWEVKRNEHESTETRLREIGREMGAIDNYSDAGQKLGALDDLMQALTTGHKRYGFWGHSVSYFNLAGKPNAETIAHMMELYWNKNEAIEIYSPKMAEEMRKIVEDLYKQNDKAISFLRLQD